MWSKYVTRRLAVQVAQAWNFGWGQAMKKQYGLKVPKTLVFFDGQKTEYFVDLDQHQKYVTGLYKLLKKSRFLKTFHSTAEARLVKILKTAKQSLKKDLSTLSNQELLNIYQEIILPSQEKFYIEMWTVFNIGEPLANVIKSKLSAYPLTEEQKTDYLLSFSTPLKANDVLKERISALRLALQKPKLGSRAFHKAVLRHTSQYCHIPVYDIDHEPYGEQYFLREIMKIKKPAVELEKIQKTLKSRQKKFIQALKVLQPSKDFRRLLVFLKENVFLRDHRDKIRQQLNMELKKIYSEIGIRLHLSLSQATLLTNQEIVSHLRAGKIFISDIIRAREQSFLLVQDQAQVKIWSGITALNLAKKELKVRKETRARIIHGITGSKGYAIGKVKIVQTNKDLHKIRPGDIMVTTMTRQDFVSAMRKAKALVTDEGSVTAHAAIIARELGLPCVVAAKNATQILKDGDRVEVDASKGIVKKL